MECFYHVRVTQKSSRSRGEVKLGLSEDQLVKRFLHPYENALPIVINGKTVPVDDIESIRIPKSEATPEELIRRAKAQEAQSSVVVIPGPSFEWLAANIADDVTDELIHGPPGYKKSHREGLVLRSKKGVKSKKKVFVVHGHDHALKSDLEVFLREIGLDPIVLHRQPDEGLTIIEKFERHSDVTYAIVLLTPDDIGYSVQEIEKTEAERKIEFRARQNVVLELGFFLGKLGRSNVC